MNWGIVSSGITTGILFSRFASGIIAGLWGWRSVYVIAAILNLAMVLIIIFVLPKIPRKNKLESYKKLLSSVFTTFKRHKTLPMILLHSGLIFGLVFNIFWTSLTFLLSGKPFNYDTFQIGLVSLAGLTAAVFGLGIGKLQDKGLSVPANGNSIIMCKTHVTLCNVNPIIMRKTHIALHQPMLVVVFQKFYYCQKNFVSEFLVLEIYTYDNFITRFIRIVRIILVFSNKEFLVMKNR